VWTLAALAVSGALVLGSTVVAVRAGVRLLRESGVFQKVLEPPLKRLERSSLLLQQRTEAMPVAQARLTASAAALNGSVARLRVLSEALDDVRAYRDALRLLSGR
jgi:hypothetical protein